MGKQYYADEDRSFRALIRYFIICILEKPDEALVEGLEVEYGSEHGFLEHVKENTYDDRWRQYIENFQMMKKAEYRGYAFSSQDRLELLTQLSTLLDALSDDVKKLVADEDEMVREILAEEERKVGVKPN